MADSQKAFRDWQLRQAEAKLGVRKLGGGEVGDILKPGGLSSLLDKFKEEIGDNTVEDKLQVVGAAASATMLAMVALTQKEKGFEQGRDAFAAALHATGNMVSNLLGNVPPAVRGSAFLMFMDMLMKQIELTSTMEGQLKDNDEEETKQ